MPPADTTGSMGKQGPVVQVVWVRHQLIAEQGEQQANQGCATVLELAGMEVLALGGWGRGVRDRDQSTVKEAAHVVSVGLEVEPAR